eukprot:11420340-Ditylum_brightwellii.AAC.1
MKIYGSILALISLNGSTVFTPNLLNNPVISSDTSLNASCPGMPGMATPWETQQTAKNAPAPVIGNISPGSAMAPNKGPSRYTKDFMRALHHVKVQGSTLKT